MAEQQTLQKENTELKLKNIMLTLFSVGLYLDTLNITHGTVKQYFTTEYGNELAEQVAYSYQLVDDVYSDLLNEQA